MIILVPSPSLSTLKESITVESRPIKRVAILPLVNYTSEPDAPDEIEGLLREELRKRGIEVVGRDKVDRFLAKRRIRYTGGITRLYAREMGKELGVDAIVVGSIDLLSDLNGEVYAGLSIRLVSAVDGSLVWADTLSYSGRDFEGVLGLGVITSMDTLTRRVVSDLVGKMPSIIPVDDAKVTPFEIERVDIYPRVTKGGDEVEIRVRFHPFSERPVGVRVRLGTQEVVLKAINRNSYEGVLHAPDREGVYTIDVIALYKEGGVYLSPAVGKVIVDNTPPKVEMEVNTKAFASRRRGYLLLRPKLLNYERIDRWKIEIVDKRGRVIRSDKGYGRLPVGLVWRGENNLFQLVEDGWYTYRFLVTDPAGNETLYSGKVRVKNRPPQVDISVEKGENELVFTFDYAPDEGIKEWEVVLLSPEGKKIKAMRGKGDLPRRLKYPLSGNWDIERLSFSIEVRDEAGNHFRVTNPVSTALIRKAPFAEKRKVLKDF